MKVRSDKHRIVSIPAAVFLALLLSPNALMQTIAVPKVAAQVEMPREDTLIIQGQKWTAPENFNSLLPVAWTEEKGIRGLLQEYLFVYNFLNDTLVPWLATGYEYGTGYGSIRIFLRKGVTWNDGVPFTSKDVVFTMEMLKENPKLLGWAWATKWIKDAVAVDDHTVLVWLNEANCRFHWELISIICFPNFWPVPEHVYSKLADPAEFLNYPNPVYTGPYNVYKVTETAVILKRDPNYWGSKVLGVVPQPTYVMYKDFGPAEKVAMALEMNELDIGGMDWTVFEEAQKRNPHLTYWSYPTPCPILVDINMHRYPLSVPEVRWAISYAINRTKLAWLWALPETRPASTWFPSYPAVQKWIFPDVLEQYDCTVYDPEKTAEILTGLGYKRGDDGVWVTDNGTRLSFKFNCIAPVSPFWLAVCEDLTAAGIEVTPDPLAWSPFWSNMGRLDYDLSLSWSQLPGVADPMFWYDHFSCKYLVPIGEDAPEGYNRERFCDPEYEEALTKAGATPTTDPAIGPLFKKMQTILLREMFRVPLIDRIEGAVYNDYYWTNFPSSAPGPNPYGVVQWWHDKLAWTTYGIRSKTLPPVLPPALIEYETVWFLTDYPAMTGADGKTYGPFKAGDRATLPKQDVETLLVEGKVSYSPPPPEIPKEWGEMLTSIEGRLRALEGTVGGIPTTVGALSTSVAGVSSKVDTLSTSVAKVSGDVTDVSGAVAGLTTAIYAAVVLSLVAAIAAIAAFIRAKPSER